MADRTAQLETAFRVIDRLLAGNASPAAQNDNVPQLGANWSELARWHLGEAVAAERDAERTESPGRRIRLLNAARMHRECAELARRELL